MCILCQLIKPSIRAQSPLVHSSIGKSTHLRCSATAPYDTSLYWRRVDHVDISSQSTRFRQQQHTNGEVIHTTLYIKDVEAADFGHYACFAESKAGRSEAKIELKEHYRPTIVTTTAIIQTSTVSQVMNSEELLTSVTTTSRIQLLKRNKVSEQTTATGNISAAASNPHSTSITLLVIICLCLNFNL